MQDRAPVKSGWEHFSHEADMGVRGIGRNLAEAFEQGAVALCAVITDPDTVEPVNAVKIELEAPDAELLFLDWLNRLVYEMAVRHMLFSRFSVVIEGCRLTATAWGEAPDRHKHELAVEVKGATFTELRVEQMGNGMWQAQCVVDV